MVFVALSLAEFTPFDVALFRKRSRQLDLLARGDFSPIPEEVRAAFPRSDLPVRAVPFAQRYVGELSGLYARPVVRRFQASGMVAESWKKLGEVYDGSRLDAVLDRIEQALWVQNSVLVVVMPDGLRRVRPVLALPWQVEVTVSDPLRADTPEGWSKVEIQVPRQVSAEQVLFGKMELTATHAWRDKGGERVGIFSADGTHPFGRIPVCVLHRIQPDEGRALAPVNEAVLNLQVALSLQLADSEMMIRHSAFPQKVIQNADLAQQVQEVLLGPDKVLALSKSDPTSAAGPTLAVVQGQLPVAQLTTWIDAQVRLYCAMLGLSADAFLKVNTALTASARLFAAQDRKALRDRVKPVLARAETDIARLVAQVLNLSGVQPLPADELTVDIAWQDATPPVDPQNEAQANLARMQQGVLTPDDIVAAEQGVSAGAARRLVDANLKRNRELGIASGGGRPAVPPTKGGDVPGGAGAADGAADGGVAS